MSLGKRIRRLRSAVGRRTQKELAELLGVPQAQLADWEYDRYAVISVRNLIKLAKVFHCSVDELLAGVDPDYDRVLQGVATAASAATNWLDIAVVAEGDALPNGNARDDYGQEQPGVLGWLPRPVGLGDPHAYGVQIRGDAMIPAYRPKMIALVSPALAVRDGDEVYGHLAHDECLVRLARTVPGGYMLQPYNPACLPRFVKHEEIEALDVIVYACRRELPRRGKTATAVSLQRVATGSRPVKDVNGH